MAKRNCQGDIQLYRIYTGHCWQLVSQYVFIPDLYRNIAYMLSSAHGIFHIPVTCVNISCLKLFPLAYD